MTATPTTLRRSRDIVTPALRAVLDRLDETSRAQARYHLGWTTPDGELAAVEGGKAVRPALALLSARAAGAPAEVGLPGAVAVELVHNFSLLHDDVMDGDTLRRHRRTVWAVWGVPSAILTGDALLALAQEVLLESGSPNAAAAGTLLATATRDLVRGQVQDLAFEQRTAVPLDECLDMVAGKTGALLSASASIGAVLAGAPAGTTAALATFGAQVGIAFQVVDDLLGIWGDPAVTGKPVYSDLRSRKKTLPMTYAASQPGAAGERLAAWLAGTDPVDEAALPEVAAMVEAAGGRDWATEEARRRMELAESALATVPMPDPPRDELVALGRFLVTREA
ncbi:polyprenyl synthetase family protein [Phytohabitans sp. ZYX-F-186]|uniref:Polyprenyl synthetase family protein n=1 Tax=Phytohabitans maris TaxID=3071409 RepID=A0ABU0ZFC6_9ACTN|nr:polyprenyl synthetase family protein [Phytohabitans sp. ZYX-F-186]MDQ7905764.1 polyprenyl synthetase family protein [Phytohabitans sp. ZYX-F-186]